MLFLLGASRALQIHFEHISYDDEYLWSSSRRVIHVVFSSARLHAEKKNSLRGATIYEFCSKLKMHMLYFAASLVVRIELETFDTNIQNLLVIEAIYDII